MLMSGSCILHTHFFLYNLALFQRKFTFDPLGNVNSSLDPGGRRQDSWRRGNTSRRQDLWRRGALPCTAGHQRWCSRGRYLGARTHGAELDATDLGADLGTMYSGAEHGFKTRGRSFPCRRCSHFFLPLSWFLPLPNPPNLLNQRI